MKECSRELDQKEKKGIWKDVKATFLYKISGTIQSNTDNILIINFYTSNIRQTIWLFRETSGIFHETRYITAVTAAINLFLSLLFGYLWGMTGIVTATVIARMVYAWWKEPEILFHKLFGEGARKYYVTYIKQICLCIFLGFVTYIICDLLPSGNTMMHFIGSIIVCAVVPNAILYICYSKSPEFGYVWERLPKNRLFRKE